LTFYFDFCRCCFCCYCFCPGAPFCCRCRCLSALQDCGAAVSNDVATRDSGHSDSDVVPSYKCLAFVRWESRRRWSLNVSARREDWRRLVFPGNKAMIATAAPTGHACKLKLRNFGKKINIK